MLQKIIQVGNSAAVTIPKDFLKTSRLKVGDAVIVDIDQDVSEISIRPQETSKRLPLTPEFFRWLKKFTAEYRPALEELAKK